MTGEIMGWGLVGTIVIILLVVAAIAATVSSMRLEMTLGRFVFFALLFFLLGAFTIAAMEDLKEQALLGLSSVLTVVGYAGYSLWRGGRRAIGPSRAPRGR